MVAKKPYLIKILRLSLKHFVYVLIYKKMTEDSYLYALVLVLESVLVSESVSIKF